MGHFAGANGGFYSLSEIVHAASKSSGIHRHKAELADEIVRSAKDADMVPREEKPIDDIAVRSASKHFVHDLGVVLTQWVQETATISGKSRKVGRFHSVSAPGMSIADYLLRIQKYFMCSDECFVIALAYIDRIGKIDPSMTVCDLTAHRLVMIAVMIAVKFHDDVYYSNKYYAKVGGLSLKEVNGLETVMLKLMDWRMHVPSEEYQLYHDLVCKATGRMSL
jgi:hypothetical protein